MKTHKLLPYDVGQSLISCADKLAEVETDLKNSEFNEAKELLKECRLRMGALFNKMKSHNFGLTENYGITDTERLEWMIENVNDGEIGTIYKLSSDKWSFQFLPEYYSTPREAIDAAMKEQI